MKTRRLAVALAVVALGAPLPVPAADGPYRKLKEIPIGGEGGWDYMSVDTAARRLYVSHATKVVVVDIDKGGPEDAADRRHGEDRGEPRRDPLRAGAPEVEVASRVREVAQARFEAGAAPRLDVMAADLGLARARADLDLARSARLSGPRAGGR